MPGDLRSFVSVDELVFWVRDARERTLEIVSDLSNQQLLGPKLDIVNPLLWEIGHVAWFQERWALRHALGEPPIRPDADRLWDSTAIAHDLRWSLPLPSRDETVRYLRAVRDRVVERLERPEPAPDFLYHALYAVFHEDMHTEAFTYTRQTLGYGPPPISLTARHPPADGGPLSADVEIAGGTLWLGASPHDAFVFDNEKWAHPVRLEPFAIARAPVTKAAFQAFVEDGGYRRRAFWSQEGWRWRESQGAQHPVYWRREANHRWLRRHFDRWVALEPHRPVIHVNCYEAEAYCSWARRRLPSEAEWEAAAAGYGFPKPRFPWGDTQPGAARANLDWRVMGTVDVGALPAGEGPSGCRHLIGNVWEWTSSVFLPYPGFTPDPYKEYSEPWFGTRRVLRGGAWTTRSRLVRSTWRNFYPPDRRDVLAGFRTCALAA
jgi:iron(II)-dependent oxidoreductase